MASAIRLQIKEAGGLQRGKTDSIDAQRIAEYAFRFRDQLRLWEPPRAVVQQLAFLSATRQRLIQIYNQLASPLAESQSFVNPSLQKQLHKSCKASLAAIDKDRKAIDKAIDEVVQADEHLKRLFELIISVPGIGTATATEVVIATNEMKSSTDPKKMACHAGVAPFNYQSGSSVRGRPGVSQHAAAADRPQTTEGIVALGCDGRHPSQGRTTGLLPTQSQRRQKQNVGAQCHPQQTGRRTAHPSPIRGSSKGRKI
ncbi:MAG: transposase [Rudanella sp.]|nr:transposase [Rudanella sp.]